MATLFLKSWTEVSRTIKNLNTSLYECMEPTVKSLKEKYVYVLEVPFGTDLIVKGKSIVFEQSFLTTCDFAEGSKKIIIEKFLADFSNKNDFPLSLVEDGIIEIYEVNKYNLFGDDLEYSFPLNIVKKSELIGTFGAISDQLCHFLTGV